MADFRALARCDNCGGVDDHPKLHFGPETYHHDCIPARVMDHIEGEATFTLWEGPGGPQLVIASIQKLPDDKQPDSVHRLRKIVAKAKSGTHGDKLLTFIGALHSEEN